LTAAVMPGAATPRGPGASAREPKLAQLALRHNNGLLGAEHAHACSKARHVESKVPELGCWSARWAR